MPKNFFERHSAACSECGNEIAHASSGSFISPFFLPKKCEHCGVGITADRMQPHWVHVTRTYHRIPPVRTLNPFTWFAMSRWEISDTFKYSA